MDVGFSHQSHNMNDLDLASPQVASRENCLLKDWLCERLSPHDHKPRLLDRRLDRRETWMAHKVRGMAYGTSLKCSKKGWKASGLEIAGLLIEVYVHRWHFGRWRGLQAIRASKRTGHDPSKLARILTKSRLNAVGLAIRDTKVWNHHLHMNVVRVPSMIRYSKLKP